MSSAAPFLGSGWAFPPAFAPGGADVAMVCDEADIEQSLIILLGTAPGERVMQDGFGCSLRRCAFEPMTQGLIGTLKSLVADAILDHEPRIDLEGVEVEAGDQRGQLLIRIGYRVRSTNSRFNLVYPFYLDQAAPP